MTEQQPQGQQINIELGEKGSGRNLFEPCHHHALAGGVHHRFYPRPPRGAEGQGARADHHDAAARKAPVART